MRSVGVSADAADAHEIGTPEPAPVQLEVRTEQPDAEARPPQPGVHTTSVDGDAAAGTSAATMEDQAFVPTQAAPPPLRDEPAGRPPMRLVEGIDTDLGGLFFLLNLGLYLELYGDFTTPLTPGIDLRIWDFITLVGRGLLAEDAMDSDPVWALLAGLAGRKEGEAPGGGFEPSDLWRVPAQWLKPFQEVGEWSWVAERGRLELWHPAGFVVVDVPEEGDPEEQARREARGYEGIKVAPGTRGGAQAAGGALKRWLGRLLPYVNARLERALRPPEGERCGQLLCAVPARVHVTATHIDVVMSLANLPIEVRLAGLDRDPGWVPAAGRYVAFYFG